MESLSLCLGDFVMQLGFVLEKSAKKCRKFCNQVARVKLSDNSEGGCNFK